MRRVLPLTLVLAALAGALAPGCDGRGAECGRLIAAVSAQGERVRSAARALQGSEADGPAFVAVAEALERAAGAVGEVALADETLQGLAREYTGMLRASASAARLLARAVAADDLAGLDGRAAALLRAHRDEPAILDRINRYCRP